MSESRARLRIDRLAFGGEGVGRLPDGKVVFVHLAAPGDEIEVTLTEDKPRYAHGRILEMISPSADRVPPPCALFGECGGCAWQHVSLVAQHTAKQNIVQHLFAPRPVLPMIESPASLGYRARAKYTRRHGRVGYQRWHTHEVVDVDTCIALEPILDRAMQKAVARARNLIGEQGCIRGLVISGRVQLAFELGAGADAESIVDAARALIAEEIVGVIIVDNHKQLVVGEPLLVDDETKFVSAATGFAQAQHAQNRRLQMLVTDALVGFDNLLELYAGGGNFTVPLLRAGHSIVAAESDPPACDRLAQNGAARVLRQSAAAATRQLRRENAQFDAVLLDPPRAGAKEVMVDLAALAPRRIVYVSCDPNTLKRDVLTLEQAGYRVTSLQPIDMMPHTAQIETICILDRS